MSLHESADNIAEQRLRPTGPERRPTTERRQKSISAFKSSDALHKLMEQKGTLNAAVEVSLFSLQLLAHTKESLLCIKTL
jgi:hypothetical protein